MFESILNAVDVAIGDVILEVWNALISAMSPWVISCMTLYVALTGLYLMIGRFDGTIGSWFVRIMKMAAVWILVANSATLATFALGLFVEAPEALANFMLDLQGVGSGDINQSVGELWDRGNLAASDMLVEASFTNPAPIVYSLVVFLVTQFLVLFVVLVLVVAKLGLTVLLLPTPVFVVLYLFEPTRKVFEGWLRQVTTFALVPVFLYSLMALLMKIMETASQNLADVAEGQEWQLSDVAPYTLVLLLGGMLLKQVPGWAAAVAGGMTLGLSSTLAARGGQRLASAATAVATKGVSKGLETAKSTVQGAVSSNKTGGATAGMAGAHAASRASAPGVSSSPAPSSTPVSGPSESAASAPSSPLAPAAPASSPPPERPQSADGFGGDGGSFGSAESAEAFEAGNSKVPTREGEGIEPK